MLKMKNVTGVGCKSMPYAGLVHSSRFHGRWSAGFRTRSSCASISVTAADVWCGLRHPHVLDDDARTPHFLAGTQRNYFHCRQCCSRLHCFLRHRHDFDRTVPVNLYSSLYHIGLRVTPLPLPCRATYRIRGRCQAGDQAALHLWVHARQTLPGLERCRLQDATTVQSLENSKF